MKLAAIALPILTVLGVFAIVDARVQLDRRTEQLAATLELHAKLQKERDALFFEAARCNGERMKGLY